MLKSYTGQDLPGKLLITITNPRIVENGVKADIQIKTFITFSKSQYNDLVNKGKTTVFNTPVIFNRTEIADDGHAYVYATYNGNEIIISDIEMATAYLSDIPLGFLSDNLYYCINSYPSSRLNLYTITETTDILIPNSTNMYAWLSYDGLEKTNITTHVNSELQQYDSVESYWHTFLCTFTNNELKLIQANLPFSS